MKTKIFYVINRLSNAGPVSVLYNLVSNINLECYDVSIVTLSSEISESKMSQFKNLPIHLFSLDSYAKSNSLISKIRAFKKIIESSQPDIVHAHCVRSLVYSILLKNNYKVVFTCHNYPGAVERVLYGNFLGTIIILLNHIFSRLADKTVACSESISIDLKKNHNRIMDYVNNGVNYPIWNSSIEEKTNLKSRLGLQQNIKYFISIGRLSPEKKMDILVDYFNRIKDSGLGLIILGDGEQYNQLKAINTSPNVIFTGYTTDVRSYIVASDYYISASDGEGLSMALLECMSVGLPMLLSDISSHRSVLSKFNDEVGFIYDKNCYNDFLNKMDQLRAIDYDFASSLIRKQYEEKYTAQVMTRNYDRIYKSLHRKCTLQS